MVKKEDADFYMLLASSIHDMKNSLSLLMHSFEEMYADVSRENTKEVERLALLNYEISRVNNDLIQLLGIYRLSQERLPLNVDEHFVYELLEELILKNEILFNLHGIHCNINCDEDLTGHFDLNLITGVINNVLVNAARYAKKEIQLIATKDKNYLCLSVADDGNGFPINMIADPGGHMKNINFHTGSTSLGLYFADKIATMHKEGEKVGYMLLENNGPLKGGVFSIYLP